MSRYCSRATPAAIFVAATLLAAGFAEAQGAPEGVPDIPFERTRLDNGLEVILHQDRGAPLVAVDLWYHVGSGDEVAGRSGFAHLFEHMMFQGARHIGEDVHFNILREIGASSVNGSTNKDRTNYFEVVPSNQLETVLWLESDRMGYMLDTLNQKSFDNQREVVRNERRQRYDNAAYSKDRFAVAAGLYPEGHPYRFLTIGRHEDLEAATIEDITAFFKTWYVPSNATLTIAGDFDTDTVKALVDKWFGTFPTLPRPEQARALVSPLQETTRSTIEDPLARLRRIHYAWHAPANLKEGMAELAILSRALGAVGWGRLYKRLVVDESLAKSVVVYYSGANASGVFHLTTDIKPKADLARVEQIIAEELDRALREPLDAAELARVVNGIEASFIWDLESVLSRAERLQYFNHYTGDPGYTASYLKTYRTRTPDQIMAVANEWLARPRVEVLTEPKKEEGEP